ncbi:MAG: SPASM domain-containing protein [Candidatus Omnitrophica bacterium]|nr:SPASM domain-containing protein [Candidatus Omnitrophota bacterium]MBU1924740.1 SPASM domain-containing protein [Candidatus Omnitrophota bacterium]
MKKQILHPQKIRWCHAGFSTCIIRANGDVISCYQMPPVGNVRKKRFVEIWRSKEMNEARKRIRKGCRGCFCKLHNRAEHNI